VAELRDGPLRRAAWHRTIVRFVALHSGGRASLTENLLVGTLLRWVGLVVHARTAHHRIDPASIPLACSHFITLDLLGGVST